MPRSFETSLPLPPLHDRLIYRTSRLVPGVVRTERYLMWANACRVRLEGRRFRAGELVVVDVTFDRSASQGRQGRRSVASLLEWIEALVIDEGIAGPDQIVSVSGGWGDIEGCRLSVSALAAERRAAA